MTCFPQWISPIYHDIQICPISQKNDLVHISRRWWCYRGKIQTLELQLFYQISDAHASKTSQHLCAYRIFQYGQYLLQISQISEKNSPSVSSLKICSLIKTLFRDIYWLIYMLSTTGKSKPMKCSVTDCLFILKYLEWKSKYFYV